MRVCFSLFCFVLFSAPAFANGYSTVLRFQDSQDTLMYLSDQFQLPKDDCIRDRKSVEAKNVVGRIRDKMKDVYFRIGTSGVPISNGPKFRADDPVDSYDAVFAFLKDQDLLANANLTKPVNLRVTCEYDVCGNTYKTTAVWYSFRDYTKCVVYIN